MDKTKELAKNTAVFAVGSIGSKLMQFLLVPIFTIYLSSSEYSAADLIVSTVFLLSPLFTIGIGNGVLRFVLDHPENRGSVLRLCINIVLLASLFLAFFIPVLNGMEIFSGYGYLVPILFLCYSMKNIFANYCKAIEKNMLYSIDGIVSAITLTIFSIVFLVFGKLGVLGYVLATILSLVLSIVYFFATCEIVQAVWKAKIDWSLSKEVVKYSFPLMPNELSWWVVQMSNRYILVYFCGAAVNGVFSMAYKIPGIFNLLVSIFISAFGITAIKECNLEKKIGGKIDGSFFGKVFEKYCAITFVSVIGIILLSKPLALFFLKKEFFDAWKYIPLLLCAYAVGNLQSFYGSIYSGLKKTGLVLLSTVLGALTSVLLNILLIPRFGAFGACFAAIASYFVIFLSRFIGLKKNVVMQHFFWKNALSSILIVILSYFYIQQKLYFSFFIAIALVLMYRKMFVDLVLAVFKIAKKKMCIEK